MTQHGRHLTTMSASSSTTNEQTPSDSLGVREIPLPVHTQINTFFLMRAI